MYYGREKSTCWDYNDSLLVKMVHDPRSKKSCEDHLIFHILWKVRKNISFYIGNAHLNEIIFHNICQSVFFLLYFDFNLIGDLAERSAVQTRHQRLFPMSLRDDGLFIFDKATRINLPVSANTHTDIYCKKRLQSLWNM